METVVNLPSGEVKALIKEALTEVLSEMPQPTKVEKTIPKDALNLNEAIQYLKDEYGYEIAKSTVYTRISLGKFPSFKIGKRTICSRKALDSWVESEMKSNYNTKLRAAMQMRKSANNQGA